VPLFSHDTKIDHLRQTPLFAELSKEELTELASCADEMEVDAGTVLTKEGDLGHEFFAIVDGDVDFIRGGKKLEMPQPGRFFGEIALVEHVPRMATVVAKTPLRFFVLNERDFRRLMDDSPTLERKIMQALARRLLALVPDDPRLG
jgi:CRP-like cAMP-binding protein